MTEYEIGQQLTTHTQNQPDEVSGRILGKDGDNWILQFDQEHTITDHQLLKIWPSGTPGVDWDYVKVDPKDEDEVEEKEVDDDEFKERFTGFDSDGVPLGRADADEADEVDATDAAVDLAKSESVDLSEVEGTGKDGRVTKPDVETFLEQARDQS